MIWRKGKHFSISRNFSNSIPALRIFTEAEFYKLNPSLCNQHKSLCGLASSNAILILGFRTKFAQSRPEKFQQPNLWNLTWMLNLEFPVYFYSSEIKGKRIWYLVTSYHLCTCLNGRQNFLRGFIKIWKRRL